MTSPLPTKPADQRRLPPWRSLGVWLLMLPALLLLGRLGIGIGERGSEIPSSEFSAQLDSDNIARAEVNPETRQLTGTLKRPASSIRRMALR